MFARISSATALFSLLTSLFTTTVLIATPTPSLAQTPLDSAAIVLDFDSVTAPNSLTQAPYPKGPEDSVTPGSLCTKPTSTRYPEKIAYCKRKVDTSLKRAIIRNYDETFGYSIGQMDRQKFKIDHLIPLCAGGSNEEDNLWPQHASVFNLTDPLEQELCEKMAQGRLLQAYAVALIKEAKNDLSKVGEIRRRVNDL